MSVGIINQKDFDAAAEVASTTKRFTSSEVSTVIKVLANEEDFGDIVGSHKDVVPEFYQEAIEYNTTEFGSVATFTAGILAGLEIANQRNLTK